jgi:predicted transcriptional regulator
MSAKSKSIAFTVRLENALYFKLEEFARATGASRAGAIERAVEFFLEHVSVATKPVRVKVGNTDWRQVAK